MAKVPLASMVASVLVGACSAADVPPTNAALQPPPQVMHDAVAVHVRAPREAPLDGGPSSAAPARAVEARVEPKTTAPAKAFTRVIERERIEARGAPRIGAGFDDATLRAAVPLDNRFWTVRQRRALLAYLRGDVVEGNAELTDADARIIAQLQAGSGAVADGVLRDETMAVLLTMGFRFSAHEAMARMPRDVSLEFYPGEIEDLDAWNREIEEKVRKKGGGFRDVDVPEGEGSIYVRVRGSIVASYRARGGPPAPLDDHVDDGEHVAEPTAPGAYKLGAGRPHVTSNWPNSQIPWGAEIRKNEDGYQYRWPGRTSWSWATRHSVGGPKEPLSTDDFEDLPEVTREGVTYLIWNKNDFGPIAWKLVPGDDLYVHTTPIAEAQYTQPEEGAQTALELSHGCIHIDPRERDEMVERGYLREGIPFVVRRWDEHLLPNELRHDLISRNRDSS